MAHFSWLSEVQFLKFKGAKFLGLIASLTQVFSVKIDEPITIGLLFVIALVLIVALPAVWFCIYSG